MNGRYGNAKNEEIWGKQNDSNYDGNLSHVASEAERTKFQAA
jgi:prolipoprotein diacylglyceryltransferase